MANRTELVKVRLNSSGEEMCITVYRSEKLTQMVREQFEDDKIDINDYEVLKDEEITAEEWAQFASEELENMNFHREIDMVDLAIKYIPREKVREFVTELFKIL